MAYSSVVKPERQWTHTTTGQFHTKGYKFKLHRKKSSPVIHGVQNCTAGNTKHLIGPHQTSLVHLNANPYPNP